MGVLEDIDTMGRLGDVGKSVRCELAEVSDNPTSVLHHNMICDYTMLCLTVGQSKGARHLCSHQ